MLKEGERVDAVYAIETYKVLVAVDDEIRIVDFEELLEEDETKASYDENLRVVNVTAENI